jgi:hypothetical protein
MSCCKGISREEQLNMKDSTWRKTTHKAPLGRHRRLRRIAREREREKRAVKMKKVDGGKNLFCY